MELLERGDIAGAPDKEIHGTIRLERGGEDVFEPALAAVSRNDGHLILDRGAVVEDLQELAVHAIHHLRRETELGRRPSCRFLERPSPGSQSWFVGPDQTPVTVHGIHAIRGVGQHETDHAFAPLRGKRQPRHFRRCVLAAGDVHAGHQAPPGPHRHEVSAEPSLLAARANRVLERRPLRVRAQNVKIEHVADAASGLAVLACSGPAPGLVDLSDPSVLIQHRDFDRQRVQKRRSPCSLSRVNPVLRLAKEHGATAAVGHRVRLVAQQGGQLLVKFQQLIHERSDGRDGPDAVCGAVAPCDGRGSVDFQRYCFLAWKLDVDAAGKLCRAP